MSDILEFLEVERIITEQALRRYPSQRYNILRAQREFRFLIGLTDVRTEILQAYQRWKEKDG